MLLELLHAPLPLYLFFEKTSFPLLFEYALEEGCDQLVMFLMEADLLRSNESGNNKGEKRDFSKDYLRVYETYLSREGPVLDCAQTHDIALETGIKVHIDTGIPFPTVYTKLCDVVWHELLKKMQKLPKSALWSNVRTNIIDDRRSIELINLLERPHFRYFFERYVFKNKEEDVLGIHYLTDMSKLMKFYFMSNGSRGGGIFGATLSYASSSGSDKLLRAIHEKCIEGSILQHTSIFGRKEDNPQSYYDDDKDECGWDECDQFLALLGKARKIHELYYPSTTEFTTQKRSSYVTCLSETHCLEFGALLNECATVREGDVESIDPAFAIELLKKFEKTLKAGENEVFQYFQKTIDHFFESNDYVMMIALEKAINTPAVQEYSSKVSFLENTSTARSTVDWRASDSEGKLYLYMKDRPFKQTDDDGGSLLHIYSAYCGDQTAQLSLMQRFSRQASSFLFAKELSVLPLNKIILLLSLVLAGNSIIITGDDGVAIERFMEMIYRLVHPFALTHSHDAIYAGDLRSLDMWMEKKEVEEKAVSDSRTGAVGKGGDDEESLNDDLSHEDIGLAPPAPPLSATTFSSEQDHQDMGLAPPPRSLNDNKHYVSAKPVLIGMKTRDLFKMKTYQHAAIQQITSSVKELSNCENHFFMYDLDRGDIYYDHPSVNQNSPYRLAAAALGCSDFQSHRYYGTKEPSLSLSVLREKIVPQFELLRRIPQQYVDNGLPFEMKNDTSQEMKTLCSKFQQSNLEVMLAFSSYFHNVFLKHLPSALYDYPKYSIFACDVNSILLALNDGRGINADDKGSTISEVSELECMFATDLVQNIRPSMEDLLIRLHRSMQV